MTKEQEKKRKKFMEDRIKEKQTTGSVTLTEKEKAKTAAGRPKFVGSKQVSNEEYTQTKKAAGTATGALADKELIAKKKQATALGLKQAGDFLTPELIQKTQEVASGNLGDITAPEGLDKSIEPLPLSTETGRAQLEQEIRRRAGVPDDFQRASLLDFVLPDQAAKDRIKNETKLLFERGKVVLRFAGDIGGKYNPLGFVIGSDTKTINDVKTSLDKRKEDVNQLPQKVKLGIISANEALQLIDNAEQDLLESRNTIKYRSITSPAARQEGAMQDVEETLLQQDRAIYFAREEITKFKLTGT